LNKLFFSRYDIFDNCLFKVFLSIHNKTVRVTAFIKIDICFINHSSSKLPVRVASQKLNFAIAVGVVANFANAVAPVFLPPAQGLARQRLHYN